MSLTTAHYDRQQLDRAIKTVESRFPGEIERILYSVGEDWTDDPAIFFRVLLKDSPITQVVHRDDPAMKQLTELTGAIRDVLISEARADEVLPYFYFRSVSE